MTSIRSTSGRPLGRTLVSLGLLVAGVVVACQPSDDPASVERDPEPLDPVELEEGAVLGTELLPAGNTAQGGQGEAVSGIGCLGDIAAHYHAHVSLFVEAERVAIPPAVGVVDPVIVDGFVENGSCLYWMHTHDGTGLVHIEPPVEGDYTLGQLFDVWGHPLASDVVADFAGELSVFVDGQRYSGDVRDIVLTSGMHVSLQIGRPLAPPPMYIFQP